jgi:DNA polymerase I-like protein with 3'-5' exonuclease and polymerase domains
VPKDEKEQAINLLRESMLSLKHECKERFNINLDMPIEVELKIGTNWLDLEGVLT